MKTLDEAFDIVEAETVLTLAENARAHFEAHALDIIKEQSVAEQLPVSEPEILFKRDGFGYAVPSIDGWFFGFCLCIRVGQVGVRMLAKKGNYHG